MKSKIKKISLIAAAVLTVVGCSDGQDGMPGPAGPAGPAGAVGPAGPAGPAGAPGSGSSASSSSILVAADRTTTLAHDLRGLTYARVAPNAGKIYASGHVGTTNADRLAVVARFNADGTPDTTFATDGFVELEATVDEANNDETSLGVAELQSGDVLVTVNAADAGGGQSVYMFRLLPDGTKAPGWGDVDGKVEVAFGWPNAQNGTFPGAPATFPSDTAWDLQVDRSVPGDRVVVFGFGPAPGGVRTDNDRFVTRLNIDATGAVPDPTFNGGAPFAFNSSGTLGDNARRGSVEADGKIVAAGYANLGTGLGNHVVIFRLNANGTLDNTFGGFSSEPGTVAATPGVAVFNPFKADGGAAECYAVVKQEGLATYVTTGYGGATSTNSVTGSTLGYRTTLGPDVVSFRVSTGTSTAVDTSWGNTGHLAIQSEGRGFATSEDRGRHALALPDDRTIHVGRFGGNPAAFVLTRDGQPDTRVFGDGVIELTHPTVNSQFFGAAVSADGKRVAMTTDANVNGARLVILKVSSD